MMQRRDITGKEHINDYLKKPNTVNGCSKEVMITYL